MFTLQETIWQLFRNKGRTIILLLASAMLAGCIAFYLGNISANEEALDQLAATTPVMAEVSNSSGDRTSGLNITAFRCDNFCANPYLTDFRMSVYGVGAFSELARAQDPFVGGDVNVNGINRLDCIWAPDGEFIFMDGYDEGFLEGEEPLCLVNREFAQRNNISVGDDVSLPIYTIQYDMNGMVYTPLGEQTLKVIGTSYSFINPKEFLVPEKWMRNIVEGQGGEFYYNSLDAQLKDPRQLNRFKDSIYDMSFLEANPEAQDVFGGTTICVDDEQYITSAENLGQTIMLFKRFQIPFFVLVIAMIVLAIFLIMRNSRHEIAIASSLGRPKFLSALANFLAAFVSETVGCILILPIMVAGAGLSISGALTICGAFLLCACVGNCLALALILHFDAFTLLTAAD